MLTSKFQENSSEFWLVTHSNSRIATLRSDIICSSSASSEIFLYWEVRFIRNCPKNNISLSIYAFGALLPRKCKTLSYVFCRRKMVAKARVRRYMYAPTINRTTHVNAVHFIFHVPPCFRSEANKHSRGWRIRRTERKMPREKDIYFIREIFQRQIAK